MAMKEKIFKVICQSCGYIGDANDFLLTVDFYAVEWGFKRKDATMKCPKCRAQEVFDRTGR